MRALRTVKRLWIIWCANRPPHVHHFSQGEETPNNTVPSHHDNPLRSEQTSSTVALMPQTDAAAVVPDVIPDARTATTLFFFLSFSTRDDATQSTQLHPSSQIVYSRASVRVFEGWLCDAPNRCQSVCLFQVHVYTLSMLWTRYYRWRVVVRCCCCNVRCNVDRPRFFGLAHLAASRLSNRAGKQIVC